MLAANVDGDDQDELDEDQPSAVAPSLATTIGRDFHFGGPLRGNYAEKREKVSVKPRPLAQSSKVIGHSLPPPRRAAAAATEEAG
jgi:hypothetical protein